MVITKINCNLLFVSYKNYRFVILCFILIYTESVSIFIKQPLMLILYYYQTIWAFLKPTVYISNFIWMFSNQIWLENRFFYCAIY